MHLSSSFVGVVSLLLSRTVAASADLRSRDLDSFVTAERAIALQGALNNIGPDGSAVPGAGSGFVVASPSKVNPDCQLFPFLSIELRLMSYQTFTHGPETPR